MAPAQRGKIVRSSAIQINKLVEYMAANTLFAAGEYTGPRGQQGLDAEWTRLKLLLAEYGPDKSIEQWKHTWRDLKKKAREEGGRVRLALNATGNAVPVPEMTDKTKKILSTIGHECATGIRSEQETAIGGGSMLFPSEASRHETENHVPEVQYEVILPNAALQGQDENLFVEESVPRRTKRKRVGSQRRPQPTPTEAIIAVHSRTNRILEELINRTPRRRSRGSALLNLKF